MNNFITTLLFYFGIILLGYVLKKLNILDKNTVKKLVNLAVKITLPIAIFLSFSKLKLNSDLIIVPAIVTISSIIMISISYTCSKLLKLEKKQALVLITACGISSITSFALPFVNYFFGAEQLQYVYLFNFANIIICWGFLYPIVSLVSRNEKSTKKLKFKKAILQIIKTPLIIGLLLGILINVLKISSLVDSFLFIKNPLQDITSFIALVSIGFYINIDFLKNKLNVRLLIIGIVICLFISGIITTVMFSFTDFDLKTKLIFILCAICPPGQATLIIAEENELDTNFASLLITISSIIYLVVAPVLTLLV